MYFKNAAATIILIQFNLFLIDVSSLKNYYTN